MLPKYTLSEIKRIVRSLQRKLALPLAVIRMRRAAEKICNDWAVALDAKRRKQAGSLPDSHEVVRSIKASGYAGAHLNSFHSYVRGCLEKEECPQPEDMVRALLPQANKIGMVYECFRWDCPPEPEGFIRFATPDA